MLFFQIFCLCLKIESIRKKKRKNNYKLKFESNRGNGYILTLMPIHKMLLNRLTRCYFPWNWTWIKTFFSLSKRDSEPIALHHWNRSTVVIINVHIHTLKTFSAIIYPHSNVYNFSSEMKYNFSLSQIVWKGKKTIWWNKNKWLNKKKITARIKSHYSSSYTIGFPSLSTHLNKSLVRITIIEINEHRNYSNTYKLFSGLFRSELYTKS